jgi:uncharacterized glyoxalase superfamily protein PhnB
MREGQPTIFPVLRYKDARAGIDWLVRAFGCEKQAEFAAPDGTIVHAEVGVGAGVLSISSMMLPTPANPWSSVRQGIYPEGFLWWLSTYKPAAQD